jgi:hypothetical protein
MSASADPEAKRIAASWKNVWPHRDGHHAVLCLSSCEDSGGVYAVVSSRAELVGMFAEMIETLVIAGELSFPPALAILLGHYAEASAQLADPATRWYPSLTHEHPRLKGVVRPYAVVGVPPLPTNEVWTLRTKWPEATV